MRPSLEGALLGAAAAVSLLFASPAMAADHRDAPTIDDYSAIDINDVPDRLAKPIGQFFPTKSSSKGSRLREPRALSTTPRSLRRWAT
jgi:hypothetical protein